MPENVESGFLPFALPDIGDDEIDAVTTALRSGWVSSGPRVKEFESAFAAFISSDLHAIAVNSATAGLHLALEAIGIAPGDEVLVPTWTFTATAEVVRYLGANPILVDVEAGSLNIDLKDAERRVSTRTKAVIPVHFAGLPVDPLALEQFAAAHSLHVVEDAAHCFPARAGEQWIGGGASAATVFSFYATKTMTTGEGGMIVTRDPALAERMRIMRLHGISRDAYDRYRSTVPAWHYEVVAPGYKYNLTDPAAAMGIVQLSRAVEMRTRRQSIAARYDGAFGVTGLTLPDSGLIGVTHAWHLYVVRLPVGTSRSAFVDGMTQRGVGTSVHFIPLHLHPFWREYGGYVSGDLPIATREFDRVVSLPIFSGMSDESVQRVISAVLEVVAT